MAANDAITAEGDYCPLPTTPKQARLLGAKYYFPGTPCPRGHIAFKWPVNSSCLECGRLKAKAYYHANIEYCRERSRRYGVEHPDQKRESIQRWRAINTDHVKAYRKAYDEANAERIRAQKKAYRETHASEAAQQMKQWRENNQEHIREYQINYNALTAVRISRREAIKRLLDPDRLEKDRYYREKYRDKRIAQQRQKYWSDPELARERAKRYRAENQEKVKEKYARWASQNRHIVKAIGAKRRASLINATPLWVDLDAIKAVYEEAIRREKLDGIKRHVDHVLPLRGRTVCGLHVAENLQILPARDNLVKSNGFKDDA